MCFNKPSRWVWIRLKFENHQSRRFRANHGNWSEKAMAPNSSTFAWRIPWTEKPGRLQSMGSIESDTTERLHFHFSLSCIREGNGNPLQGSCLENPRDGEAWWAVVYGIAQNRTWLKRLSSGSSSMATGHQRYFRNAVSPLCRVSIRPWEGGGCCNISVAGQLSKVESLRRKT